MWMLPREAWGVWEGEATTRHLDLEAELGLWSGVSTAGDLGTPAAGRL
jgi:hypothetical protein